MNMNNQSALNQENSKTKRNQVKVAEPHGTNWRPITEEEWSKIQDQHWQSLSRWLTANK